jgi:excinuclease ABC subunit B
VGINLLREGLDIPECALVAILDADKEGFLRSETALVQTIGRAARNVDGRVILYADTITGSMERAIAETDRRRDKQAAYNLEHGITPESIKSNIKDILASPYERDRVTVPAGVAEDSKPFLGSNFQTTLRDLEAKMREAASNLEFETAARLRDEIKRLKMLDLEFANDLLTPGGEAVDKGAVKQMKAAAKAEAAERFRKGRHLSFSVVIR